MESPFEPLSDNIRQADGKDVVAEAIAAARKADEMRGAAIKELLARQEQILRDLKTLGYSSASAQNGHASQGTPETIHHVNSERNANRRFKDLSLAESVGILLRENDVLHGKDIEKLIKAGGFQSKSENFQNYLPVALHRAGGFENIGGNRWKINPSVEPRRQ